MAANLLVAALATVDQLVRVLQSLCVPVLTTASRAPTLNGEGEVELSQEQFRDVVKENRLAGKSTLLHLRGCLEGPAKTYSRGESIEAVFTAI